jgi:hypothetical protein
MAAQATAYLRSEAELLVTDLVSAATFDGHEDDTFHEHEFVNMVSPSWTSAVAW